MISEGKTLQRAIMMLAVGCALVAFWGAAHINNHYLEKTPHVQDSVNYYFQAQLYGMGKTSIEEPPNIKSFASEHIIVQNKRWYCHYPFFLPLLFMIGLKLGIIWLVNPLIAFGSVLLVFWIGKEHYSAMTGLWAAILLTSSPFFMVMSASFMSHPTGLFLTTVCLYYFLKVLKKPCFKYTVLLGLVIGLLFNTRPLTAFAIGAISFSFYIRNRDIFSKKLLKHLVLLLLCSAIGVGVFFAYSSHLSGKTLQFATHTKVSDVRGPSKVKFINRFVNSFAAAGVGKKGHSPERGLGCVRALTELYHTYSLNWPGWFNLSFMLIPFVYWKRREEDRYLFWTFFCLPAFYTLYWRSAIMYGPRYIYEILPMTVLLSARGIDVCLISMDWLHEISFMKNWRTRSTAKAITALFLYGFVGWMIYTNVNQFFLKSSYSLKNYPPVSLVPMKLSSMKNFNGVKRKIPNTIESYGITNAIVFVDDRRWQGFGSVARFNTPTLDTDIIYAKYLKEEQNKEVMKMFPDKDAYYTYYPNVKLHTLTLDPNTDTLVKKLYVSPEEAKKKKKTEAAEKKKALKKEEKQKALEEEKNKKFSKL